MKQVYIFLVILLVSINVGCTRNKEFVPEASNIIEEVEPVSEVSDNRDEKPLPEESGEVEKSILYYEEERTSYVNSPEGLRVRDKPDISGERIFLLKNGEKVNIIAVYVSDFISIDGIHGRWVQIETDDITGWVFSGYLTGFKKRGIDEQEDIAVETELEAFADRYGGELRQFTGDSITYDDFVFQLICNEKMLSSLGELSDICFDKIVSLAILSGEQCSVIPPLDDRLKLLTMALYDSGVENIDTLAKTRIGWLLLDQNPLTSIEALGNNPYIEVLILYGCTNLNSLPDMSGMKELSNLDISGTGITTLDNLETIPHSFSLDLFWCKELTDIDALRKSKVIELSITREGYGVLEYDREEEGLYDKFREWFDQYLPELEQKNGFRLFYFYEGLD